MYYPNTLACSFNKFDHFGNTLINKPLANQMFCSNYQT